MEIATDIKSDNYDSIFYVGIGASAGGLEALQDFFKPMPLDTGMVFIVIQHLSPDYKSLMNELLARHTNISIKIAEDGMETKPNTIYLIPPKNNLTIFHGRLYLEEQKNKKGLNLPIDIFFRSLAIDKEKNSIGVILSGTGSDGTLGIKAIKEAGGMVMVQDDQSAKFDGMPRSCIATGLVDYILSPNLMADELLNYIRHPLTKKDSIDEIMNKNLNTLSKIILVLREYCGIDFSHYRENTIIRRLERRVSINRFNTLEEYLEFLCQSEKEKDTLYREMLIGVTRFFRDKEAFHCITEKVLPQLFINKKLIRIWSAGCSTGEEVYSVAMTIREFMDKENLDCDVKIFATDIDRNSLDVAGQGFYVDGIVSDIEPHLLTKYFNRRENGYQVKDFIRKMVVFAAHNILKDPPFSKLDLLICRNLFIYFKPDTQQKLLSMFYYSLSPNGYLFLGSSETIGDMDEGYQTIDSKWKLYKYKSNYKPPIIQDTPNQITYLNESDRLINSGYGINRKIKLEKLFETVMSSILPPSVIIDSNDNIIQVVNDMNPFFDIKPGKFSSNILKNLSIELGAFVSNILRRLKFEKKEMLMENIIGIKGFENEKINIRGCYIPLENNDFYLLSFLVNKEKQVRKDSSDQSIDVEKEVKNRVSELEQELQTTKERLQVTIEEIETSNEELQSSNEELIASNEELQSTNEELQSVNEELYTVNSEYQLKIDELTRLNNDLNNLLKNTDVGALYLDRNLCIRKITPIVSKITNILPTDIGRPISHISFMNDNNDSNDLLTDVESVVENLKVVEKEIMDSEGNFWMVKINPYRTEYNAVDGILLTYVDINKLKQEQNRVLEVKNRLEQALEIGKLAWWEWDVKTGTVIYDDKKATMLGYTTQEFPNDVYKICELIHPEDYEQTMQAMRNHLQGKSAFWEATYRIKRKDGGYSWYRDRGMTCQKDSKGLPLKIIGTVVDISEQKEMESQISNSQTLLEMTIDTDSKENNLD
jgi:two-component system CheB/CheR fusion protein